MLNQDSLALVFDELDVKDLMEVNNYFVLLLLHRLVRQWNYIYYIYIYINIFILYYIFIFQ